MKWFKSIKRNITHKLVRQWKLHANFLFNNFKLMLKNFTKKKEVQNICKICICLYRQLGQILTIQCRFTLLSTQVLCVRWQTNGIMKEPVKQQGIDVLFGFSFLFCVISAHILYALLHNFEETFVWVLCICVSNKVCVEGKKTVTWQEWKGEISCLFEKDTCRIHARLAIAMSLLALQMCFLTHNRLQLDLIVTFRCLYGHLYIFFSG